MHVSLCKSLRSNGDTETLVPRRHCAVKKNWAKLHTFESVLRELVESESPRPTYRLLGRPTWSLRSNTQEFV
jgi:hypothetical protein